MKRILSVLLVLTVLLPIASVSSQPLSTQGVAILCYHDVGPYSEEGRKANVFTVTPQVLRSHFDYLKNNGYTVISLDDYIQFANGLKQLPAKSVLITFDDAYLSFYEQVFPLLKEYNYPAVLAMVGVWQDGHAPDAYRLINWDQAREMSKSGLVEIASHSYSLHYQLTLNDFADVHHAAVTRRYANGTYEPEEVYKRRVQADLRQSQELFQKELGKKARAMVWPYGAYNEITIDIALAEGFEVTFGLEGGFNYAGESSRRAGKRGIIWGNPPVGDFAKFIAAAGFEERKLRVLQIDLDALYDPDKIQFEANITMLIDRIRKTNANAVFLQAVADDKGDGNVRQVYFYNTQVPIKADIFSHVVKRLANANVRVFAWMPTLAVQTLAEKYPQDTVQAYDPKGKGWYTRATPFSPRVRANLNQLFAELAMYSPISGILFQDDLYMTDYEDFSPPAAAVFRERFGVPLTVEAIKDPSIAPQWTKLKSDTMNDLTVELMATVRKYRSNCPSARNIYAEAVINPKSFEWFAQDYQSFLKTYDYTVIMAYPYMEKQGERAVAWLQELANAALREKSSAAKVVFKLQNYDWTKQAWVPRAEISAQVRALKSLGVLHVGYYPENVFSERHDYSPF